MVVCYLHDVRSILQLRSLKKVRSSRLWDHAGSPRHRICRQLKTETLLRRHSLQCWVEP